MLRPNFFNYATKESSQDAIICWLIDCINSEDENYRIIGESFIRNFVFNGSEGKIQLLQEHPNKQYSSIDVFTYVKKGNLVYPIIFENKTESFLHSKQFENYCVKVTGWMKKKKIDNCEWGDILYILFKTGYLYDFQISLFDKQSEEVKHLIHPINIEPKIKNINDMICFLESLDPLVYKEIDIMSDYLMFLKQQLIIQNESFDNWNSEDREMQRKSYSIHVGQVLLFECAFNVDASKFYFGYDSSNYLCYSVWKDREHEINCEEDNQQERIYNTINYLFRFDERVNQHRETDKNGNSIKDYCFIFQQYRKEKDTQDINGFVKKELSVLRSKKYESMHSKVKLIIEKISEQKFAIEVDYKEANQNNMDSRELFRIFVNEKNKPKNVCAFIREFISEFQKEFNEEK